MNKKTSPNNGFAIVGRNCKFNSSSSVQLLYKIEDLCFDCSTIGKPLNVSVHTMNGYININEIVELVKQQQPLRKDEINALTEFKSGQWHGNAYFQLVDSENANQDGAEWQFDENIIIEHQKKGIIIIDFMKKKNWWT